MCIAEAKATTAGLNATPSYTDGARINGRTVLQPTCNRVLNPTLQQHPPNSLKKAFPKSSPPPLTTKLSPSLTPPLLSPNSISPSPAANSRPNAPFTTFNSSSDKFVIPPATNSISKPALDRIKKSKSFKLPTTAISTDPRPDHKTGAAVRGLSPYSNKNEALLSYSSSLITESPGSIAAVRREQMALQQAQRKMRIAHYGRSKSARFESANIPFINSHTNSKATDQEEKSRCSFITANSDPIYVNYHDEEWGVPVHDDKMLFELLILSAAQVGSDWTSILKKRLEFRSAFSGFEAETVAGFNDNRIMSISSEISVDIGRVRGIVDNSHRILEIKKEFGSFDKYIWGFVNHKPISTQYRAGHKVPVKTSKSESISKDMVRRGFRFVGPTIVHSFMQATGLTNDHLISCHRHFHCTALAAHRPAIKPTDL